MNEQDNIDLASQSITVEDGSPHVCKAPSQPMLHKMDMFAGPAGPCFITLIYLAVVIFMIVLFYRLVRATEKIAAKLESGITVKKENTETTI